MLTTLPTRLKQAGKWLPVLLLPFATQAQTLNYMPASARNIVGTYSDLGTAGTAIVTANFDNANSAATPIGFSFSYNGGTFTQFVLNTNGYLKLGATFPAAPFFGAGPQDVTGGPLNSADSNLILPFNYDLEAGTGTPEYRVATTGTSPNQVTTIQWKNVSPKTLNFNPTTSVDKQFLNMNFQVKLYEGSNTIEFVYGPATSNTATSSAEWAVAGLKGSGSAAGQTVLVEKLSSIAWSGATFISGAYTSINAFNIRQTFLPDPGRTYRFVAGSTTANTRNEALAATVGLYPVPAHQNFKLVVPAGFLCTASATLLNALGQVAQQRQLNLPLAGGIAEFNVSGLPSGVYSLQLKAGNGIVVKRMIIE
jgi:hypothetical protein